MFSCVSTSTQIEQCPSSLFSFPLHLPEIDCIVFTTGTYDDLHAFSVTRLNDFWMTVWEFAAVKASEQPARVRALSIDEL